MSSDLNAVADRTWTPDYRMNTHPPQNQVRIPADLQAKMNEKHGEDGWKRDFVLDMFKDADKFNKTPTHALKAVILNSDAFKRDTPIAQSPADSPVSPLPLQSHDLLADSTSPSLSHPQTPPADSTPPSHSPMPGAFWWVVIGIPVATLVIIGIVYFSKWIVRKTRGTREREESVAATEFFLYSQKKEPSSFPLLCE